MIKLSYKLMVRRTVWRATCNYFTDWGKLFPEMDSVIAAMYIPYLYSCVSEVFKDLFSNEILVRDVAASRK